MIRWERLRWMWALEAGTISPQSLGSCIIPHRRNTEKVRILKKLVNIHNESIKKNEYNGGRQVNSLFAIFWICPRY